MRQELTSLVAAIRAQPWAIMPEYLDAIEAIAVRALDEDILARLAGDGHADRVNVSLSAVAAVGTRLEGARMSTVRNGTAVVPLIGTIFPRASMISSSTDGTSLAAYMSDMRVAQASRDVDRIVTLVDSPGGVVSGLGEAAAMMRASQKPITAFVTGIGASAAYWLASQAQEIVMDQSASVGSIGVVASMSRQEAAGADGRRTYEIVSSGAPNKRPDPSTEEGRASIQQEVDAVETVFIGDVAAGRKTTTNRVRAEFGQGAMISASRAVAVGMADRIGTLEALLSEGTGRTRTSGAGRSARAVAEIETRRRAAQRT